MNAVEKISDHMPTSMPIPQATSSNQLLAVLSRMMADPSVDIERIERGAALYERALARDRETEFDAALAAVQTELGPIARDSNNPQTRSKYASYFAIDKAIRPAYGRHGFALSFDTEEGGPPDHTRVVALLSRGGHTRRYHYESPIITKGMKGNEMMTLTHAGASAVTYAKRYLAGMIFNLSTGEDADGNTPADTGGFIGDDQVKNLIDLCDRTGSDKGKFCQKMKVESIPAIREGHYQRAVEVLKNNAKIKGITL